MANRTVYRGLRDIKPDRLAESLELLSHASNDLGMAENFHHLEGTRQGDEIGKIREWLTQIIKELEKRLQSPTSLS